MPARSAVTMDDEERDEFLGDGGVGVISFGTAGEDPPHSLPVSYGYDTVEETFYFRLAVGPDSRKPPLSDRAVAFVTYGDDDGGSWRSVVASGRLEPTDDDEIAVETLEGLSRVGIPLFDVFEKPTADVQFEFYRLIPDELTGRKESSTGE